MNITDMPVWSNHPWVGVIPHDLEVRRSEDGRVVSIVSPSSVLHADFLASPAPTSTDVMNILASLKEISRKTAS